MRSEGVGHPAVPAPIGEGFSSGDAGFSLHGLHVIENTMIGGGFNLGEFSGFRRAAGITNNFATQGLQAFFAARGFRMTQGFGAHAG